MRNLRLRVEPRDGVAYRYDPIGGSLVVGRSRRADLTLADAFVSRRHARFFLEAGAWWVEDLGSHNPWTGNGEPVEGKKRVAPGDVFVLGGTCLHVLNENENEAGAGAERGATDDDHETTVYRSAASLVSAIEAPPSGPAPVDRNAARLRVLNDVHRALAGPIALDALLGLMLDRAFEHLRPEEGAVFLIGPDHQLRLAAQRRPPGAQGQILRSRRLALEVTGKGLAALVNDARQDERFVNAESIIDSGVRSLLAAPLQTAEGCLGMIVLSSRGAARPFDEEDLALLACLASAAALRIRNIALTADAVARQALEKELALAHDIQMAMLPRPIAHRPEFDLSAMLRPARSVGGDLYDFFIEGSRLWFLVGDVSGKGMGAALFMAVTKTLCRATLPVGPSLAEVLDRVNRELCHENEKMMFVTLFVGCLELATGELTFANAGHGPLYLIKRDGSVLRVSNAHGVALGVVEEASHPTARLLLESGDGLCLCTDGVTEAENARTEQFGEERLLAYLGTAAGRPAAELIAGAVRTVDEFAADYPQSDDIAMLFVRYLSRPREQV